MSHNTGVVITFSMPVFCIQLQAKEQPKHEPPSVQCNAQHSAGCQ